MLSLRVHALIMMQGQLTAALEGKDWSASPPSEMDDTGINSGHSVVGTTGQMQTCVAQMPTQLS